MTDTLTALDATFLELEQQDDGALMGIGGVSVFDPLPDGGVPAVEEICSNLASRLGQLPRYSQRLSSVRTGGLAWPRWVCDDRFDIRDHGSVDVAYLLLDTEPNPPELPLAPQAPDDDLSVLTPFAAHPPQQIVQVAKTGAHATRAGLHAARHPREAFARSRSLAELLVRDELLRSAHCSLNRPIGSTRRFTVINVPLAGLKAIRRQLKRSLNDVVLAACTAGLRALLLERGESPPRHGLRAMVPMNVRDVSEHLALGNRVSSLFVELPVAAADVLGRYQQIVSSTSRLKSSEAAIGTTTMMDLAALAPPVLHATLARSLYATRLFNITITNVPGPQIPLYAHGAQLREVHPPSFPWRLTMRWESRFSPTTGSPLSASLPTANRRPISTCSHRGSRRGSTSCSRSSGAEPT